MPVGGDGARPEGTDSKTLSRRSALKLAGLAAVGLGTGEVAGERPLGGRLDASPPTLDGEAKTWLSDEVPETPLSDLCLPGTHHSAMYDGGPDWWHCQSRDLYTQLSDGIRVLDVRAGLNQNLGDDEFRAHHGGRAAAPHKWGASLESEALPDIRRYLEEVDAAGATELVVLRLSHFWDSRLFQDDGFDDDLWAQFRGLLDDHLGEYILDLGGYAPADLRDLRPSDLDGPRVAVLMTDPGADDANRPSWAGDEAYLGDGWLDEVEPGVLYGAALTQDHTDGPALGNTSFAVTPDTGAIVNGSLGIESTYGNLREAAERTNALLAGYADAVKRDSSLRPNVLSVDYYGESSLVEQCRELSAAGVGTVTDRSPPIEEGLYRLDSAATDAVATVANASTEAGADVQIAPDEGDGNQRFALVREGEHAYRIEAAHSEQVVEVAEASTDNGGNVQQWEENGGDNQRWYVVPLSGDGQFVLLNVNSGLVLDASDEAEGATVHQWALHARANQRWALDRVGDPDDPVTGEIEIRTDEYDVSHIYADNLHDLGWANGYVQARDRLFQMDVLRRVGRGTSAELVGPRQIESDVEVKRDLYTEAELQTQWETADETTRTMIEGFCEGVNTKVEELRADGEFPGEYDLLGGEFEPWTPTDTIAVVSYALGFFGVSGGNELANAKTLATMFERFEGEREAWQAFGDYNKVVVPDSHYGSLQADEIESTDARALSYDEVPEEQLEKVRAAANTEPWGLESYDIFAEIEEFFRDGLGLFEGSGFGSNAIVVGGEYTETGQPMLGGGPQMSLLKPPVIYEVGLHGEEFDVAGIGVVGAPAVIVGRTAEFAYTATTSFDDMVDTIAVDLHPEDRYRYRWDGEYHEFETAEYVHEPNLRGGLVDGDFSPQKVTQEVAYVRQEGTKMPVVAYNDEANVAWVQRTSTRLDELSGAFKWADAGRATSRADFEQRIADFPFGFNLLFVDDEEIALYRTGKLPVRERDGDPRLPVSESDHEWSGFEVGTDIGASVVDPERGYVVNWNNAPGAGWRSNDAPQQWGSTHRVDVMARLVGEAIDRTGGSLSLADVEGIIADCSVEHPFAPALVPTLVAIAQSSGDQQLQAMGTELQRWADTDYSFRNTEDDDRYPNGGMAIWEEVRRQLQQHIYRDKLGERYPDLTFDPTAGGPLSSAVDPHAADHGPSNHKGTVLVEALNGQTNFDWFQPISDAGFDASDPGNVIEIALSRAAETLTERFDSSEPSDWRLQARQCEFAALGGAAADTIDMTNRASYQQAIAMQGTETVAKSVLPPSNRGQLSTWEVIGAQLGLEPDRLTDQLDLYANFEYKHHPMRREAVEQRDESVEKYYPD
jgi:acyl-homoserine lactone acylase PvdQ